MSSSKKVLCDCASSRHAYIVQVQRFFSARFFAIAPKPVIKICHCGDNSIEISRMI